MNLIRFHEFVKTLCFLVLPCLCSSTADSSCDRYIALLFNLFDTAVCLEIYDTVPSYFLDWSVALSDNDLHTGLSPN